MHAVDRRAFVTAAMGELADFTPADGTATAARIPAGVALFKLGLAGCGQSAAWQSRWHTAIAALQANADVPAQAVAVVYADWRAADAPSPQEVLAAAAKVRSPALLVDTWNKTSGSVFDHWPIDELRTFIAQTRTHQLAFVLAGSLSGESFELAIKLAPDLVAVRGAACDAGRDGTVTYERVCALKRAIEASKRVVQK